MKNFDKLLIPVSILIGSIILGWFYYSVQENKQKSIERQQQAELMEKKEQQKREFSASQKESCLAIYKQESSKWNNVDGWRYSEDSNVCYIQYRENSKKTKAQCDAEYKGDDGKVYPWAFMDWMLCNDGLFEKTF